MNTLSPFPPRIKAWVFQHREGVSKFLFGRHKEEHFRLWCARWAVPTPPCARCSGTRLQMHLPPDQSQSCLCSFQCRSNLVASLFQVFDLGESVNLATIGFHFFGIGIRSHGSIKVTVIGSPARAQRIVEVQIWQISVMRALSVMYSPV